MDLRPNKNPRAYASVIALTWAALAGWGASAATATATTDAAAADAEVVVTGTNITGAAPVGSTVLTVDRDQIVASGAVTTAQLLEQTPQVFNLGVSEQSRGQAGGSGNINYGTTIDLRGLGPYSTLTLVDGHRVVPQGTSGQSVDPSIIPTIMLQRVDIEADGASATYGSDAIGGVVNLILRRNFEGVEVSGRYGAGNHFDERQVDAIVGHKWGTGQITIGFENGEHSALNGRYRDFYSANLTSRGGSDFRTTSCNPGNIIIGANTYPIPAGGVTPATANLLVAGTANKCDNLKLTDLLPMQDHYSAAFTINQDVGERVSLSLDGFYAKRDYVFNPAPAASTLTVPSNNPYFVAPPGVTLPFCKGSTTLTCETVAYSFLKDVPVAQATGGSTSYQLSFGAKVKLFGDWKAEGFFGWGVDDDLSISSVGVVNGIVSGSPTTVGSVNNTVAANAFNPFGAAQTPAVTAAIGNALFNSPGGTTFYSVELKVDGTLFTLPGGPVKAAMGYQGQRQEAHLGLQTGSVTNPSPATNFTRYFGRDVQSYYGEILVPIVGEGNARPGFKELDIDLAGRVDHYTDINATTQNPKIGVNWTPVDGLKIRGSYGTSFRAPVFSQIYGNSQGLFVQPYSDPTCNCTVNGVTVSGGNLGLQPETATTWSIGADFAPPQVPGLKMSITYFDVNYTGEIANFLADLSILQREGQFANSGVINRNPTDAYLAQFASLPVLVGVLPNACGATPTPAGCSSKLSGVTLFVDGRNKNLGATVTNGIDFTASYAWPTKSWGDFGVGINGTYFTEFQESFTPSGPLLNVLNTTFNPLRLKFRANANWHMGGWNAIAYLNYANGYTNPSPLSSVAAYVTVDAHVGYTFGENGPSVLKNLSIAVDAQNLLDQDPPFVNIAESANGGGGWDPVNANPVGRVVAVTIDKRF